MANAQYNEARAREFEQLFSPNLTRFSPLIDCSFVSSDTLFHRYLRPFGAPIGGVHAFKHQTSRCTLEEPCSFRLHLNPTLEPVLEP